MSRRRLALALAALAVASLAAWSDDSGKAPRRAVYPHAFPEGPGKAIADRACQTCHSPTLVTQQAKDSTAWEKTIGQMEKWGVTLTAEERDSLQTYLLAHYGPRAR